jgi:hypothetical protein
MMKKLMAAAIAIAMVPSTATAAEKKADQSEDMGDPNRTICKRVEMTGSRLAVRKDCRTAGEWAEMRAQQRTTTERIQHYKPCGIGAGCD